MNGLKQLFPNNSALHIVEDKNKGEYIRKVNTFLYEHLVTQVTHSIKEDTYVAFIMYVSQPKVNTGYSPHDVGR